MGNKLCKSEIEPKLESRGIEMVGEYLGSFFKTEFKCSSGHIWAAQARKVIGGTGCPHCHFNLKRSGKEQVNEKLKPRGIQMIGDYLTAKIKTEFSCNHNHTWQSIPDNVIRGSGCPECATSGFDPTKSSDLYILRFENFLKIGITNNLNRRLEEHKKNGKYSLIVAKSFDIGYDARTLEDGIKNRFGGRFVTKEECPDGYTETFCVSILDDLISFIQN